VIGRHHPDRLWKLGQGMKVAAQGGDGGLHAEEGLGGEGAERADDLRANRLNLLIEEGAARGDFVGLRVAVARRSSLDDHSPVPDLRDSILT